MDQIESTKVILATEVTSGFRRDKLLGYTRTRDPSTDWTPAVPTNNGQNARAQSFWFTFQWTGILGDWNGTDKLRTGVDEDAPQSPRDAKWETAYGGEKETVRI